MILLAVDTSGRNGSLALVRAEDKSFDTLALEHLEGRMYSAQLIPALQHALAEANLTTKDIEAFAVASGPGSFTGLRVGLSTIKGLAEVTGKPIAAVSVLEAAARVTDVDSRVLVALDAGRKQAFVGDYDFRARSTKELLVTWEEFFQLAKPATVPVFSPDAALRDAAAVHQLRVTVIASPQADTYARIGYEKLSAGDSTSAEVLEANYLRASDAELFSLPKLL
jgi:tRNA threonylcarbamoyladenosine biosynthesis protein TsaB